MKMRVFLDVGAHIGQTLEEVIKEEWGFDLIYSFEPMPGEFAKLSEKFGKLRNVRLFNYGLLDRTEELPMYGANDGMEATVLPDMSTIHHPEKVTMCRFVEARAFIDSIPQEEGIILKLNCEGSEVAILDNLIDTGRIGRIFYAMIDPDYRHMPRGMEEIHRVLDRLKDVGFDRYFMCDEVMIGPTHQERTANWLRKIPWPVTGKGYM